MSTPDPLVRRAQGGDEAAFHELFVRHRGDVTRLVFRVLGGSPDVEDVVQDVFVHVYRSLPKFRGDAKFSTWLYRLTLNVARMHLRRGRSRPRFRDVPVPESPRADQAPQETPDRMAERAIRIRTLRRLIETLGEKKRIVLVLHDLEGVPAKDIAEIVGAPVLTVRTRLFYARKELYAAIAADPNLGPFVEAILPQLPGGGRGRARGATGRQPSAGPGEDGPASAEEGAR